ncbi:VWA domain-containing protein [Geminisphaera colitermitum]|uniref:VWA domain-containing protein n=1 Tax=Geminisphaera colitermitum TaxID=1148786 RepID=UPI0007DC4009|nr:VWA domain-containing protein [Geminisphaera colitermitum]RRJ99700.1 VWA domain-containing protein [Opitutaceae bacterium TAV3]
MNYTLQNPLWLLALLLLPLILWARGRRKVIAWIVPYAAAWHRPSQISPSRLPIALATLGLTLLIAALARPQRIEDRRTVTGQGYDLILAIDLSTSMLAEDYERHGQRQNRLQTIRPVIEAFIDRRPDDRIGIVVFAGRSYTLAPLTLDHDWLARQVQRLKTGLIEDGTAIGDGLGVALSRLEQATHTENGRRAGAFIILLTDGANNRGALTPAQAAAIAKSRGIPVYTIGVGTNDPRGIPYPVFDDNGQKLGYRRVRSDLDENSLRYIATETGGRYYRADHTGTVEAAFKSIDEARKIEYQAKSHILATELFPWPAIPGAALVLLAALTARREMRN